ncbi:hypothetical protein [Streptomyces sp. NPDC096033]|uniref:hypothetical protein n=1 Tax=Streptomyces sp. NPDC096033 TaxID=3366071 RepID=UPI00380E200F
MRVRVLDNCSAYFNHGIVLLGQGEHVKGELALHLLRTGANVDPLDDDAKAAYSGNAASEGPAEVSEDSTSADILAWVGQDPDRAAEALAAEQGREKPRSTLVKQLEKLASAGEE